MGTGLLALDVVVNGNVSVPQMLATGGTCGNVLINLAFLGWDSFPVARIKDDWAGNQITEDLARWGVHDDFIRLEPPANTPIVIHRINRPTTGGVTHSFSWSCPCCDRRLPPYNPVTIQAAATVPFGKIAPQVFFFDRPSPSAVRMARAARDLGALIVFEFAGKGSVRYFSEALEICHILKYAEERKAQVPDLCRKAPFVEVVTHGSEGLSFRCNLRHCSQKKWLRIAPYKLASVKDTAGAGDWCTAGLIDILGRFGLKGLAKIRRMELIKGLCYAQAYAAINCCFEGARGSMYELSAVEFKEFAQRLVETGTVALPNSQCAWVSSPDDSKCPVCGVLVQ